MSFTLFAFVGGRGSNIDSGIRLSPRMIYRLVMKLTKRASCGLVRFSYVAGQPFAPSNMERICMYFGYFAANASLNVVVVMVCVISCLCCFFFFFSFFSVTYFKESTNYDSCQREDNRHPAVHVDAKYNYYDYPKYTSDRHNI